MFNVEYVKDLVYANEENTRINCTVKFGRFTTEVPFTACPTDVESHGREIFQDCIDGKWGEIAAYVPPPPKPVANSEPVVI